MISIASGGGPIQATPRVGDGAGEVGVLGEEPVPGVHGLGAALLDRVEDGVGVEVALGRGLAAERVRLVGVADVQRVAVELGVDGDGGDAELAAGAHDPDGDLAAVGDQDFAEHGAPRVLWRQVAVSYGGVRTRSHLGTGPVAGRMVRRRSTPPTATLLDAARDGAPDGLVVVADHQTAGRGRLGRTWEAPPGSSLLCRVLLRDCRRPAHRVVMAAGVALARAVAEVAGVDGRA